MSVRVTMVGAFPPQQKGEAHYLGRYVDALRCVAGAQVTVVSQYVDRPSIETFGDISVRREIADRSKTGTSYRAQRELADAVRDTKADVMHLHYGPGPDYGGRLGEALVPALRAVQAEGIKTVLTLHSIWLPADVSDQASRLGVPRFLHAPVVAYFGHFMRSLRRVLDAELCLVSSADSPMTAAFSRAYNVRDPGEEIHATEPRIVPYVPSEDPLVFAFGFLRPDKGFDHLIEAFRRHVAAGGKGRLLIAGRPQSAADEPYARGLTEAAKEVVGNRCEVQVRYLSDDELETMLARCDVIAVPYLRNVGASGPLHHAIGVGKPLIVSDAGHNAAFRGVLEVFRAGDINALEASLSRVLGDEPYRRKLAGVAANVAIERSWDALARRNFALYERLVRNT